MALKRTQLQLSMHNTNTANMQLFVSISYAICTYNYCKDKKINQYTNGVVKVQIIVNNESNFSQCCFSDMCPEQNRQTKQKNK